MSRSSAGNLERRFHDTWLGMAQPIEGLVVSRPVLEEAQCFERQPPQTRQLLRQLVEAGEPVATRGKRSKGGGDALHAPRIGDLPRFLSELLGLTPDLWDAAKGYRPDQAWAGVIDPELSFYAPEGPQTVRPTLALRRIGTSGTAEAEDTGDAGPYTLLLWELPARLPFDTAETTTGAWHYPPGAKFDRLLRHCRVPIGLLTNGEVVRLVYAPHGEASGHIDFRLDAMVSVGGAPLLDAFVMLLHERRFFAVAEDQALPALLAQSRSRQADVTGELGEQVLEALTHLLRGFERAAGEHDGRALLDAALAREGDHLYNGLLTLLLRTVFVLYAEDKGLLPIDHPLYEQHYSLLGLFDELQADHGLHPDTMSRRYGAWGRVTALFRMLFCGARSGDLQIPERRGELFSPHRFAFLEGWQGEASPIGNLPQQAEVHLPSVDDETLYLALQKLVMLDGQRLSYRSLSEEQLGSCYEGLLGYHIVRVDHPAVRMRPEGVWLTAEEVLAEKPGRRAAYLVDKAGLDKKQAKKLASEMTAAEKQADDRQASETAFAVLQGYALGRTKAARAEGVAGAGQLVVQPGQERRRTSSHYTPRSLTSQVVQRTLEPLLACMTLEGALGPSSERLLELRICDPAMGSGAFLVEACRQLGDHLEAAWAREGKLGHYTESTLAARRRVAQCCLYGVDKNPAAVELAKLSLWLFTLSDHRPFTFLDANLKCGDSLVGLSLDQIRAFDWRAGDKRQGQLVELAIDDVLREAVKAREDLRQMAMMENGYNPDPREKERLHEDAQDAMERVTLIGDVCLGAFFSESKDKARERQRVRRRDLVVTWLEADKRHDDELAATLKAELQALQAELHETQRPFHWLLEFPDVMWEQRPDPLAGGEWNGNAMMDAFVGNPPFMGGRRISENLGLRYSAFISGQHGGSKNADLSAHFFRRVADIIGTHGTFGLIATNTIGQGDTRATGLQCLVKDGLEVYDARTNIPWSQESAGSDAAVTVSIVHMAAGLPAQRAERRCEGRACTVINSQLAPRAERNDPDKLIANAGAAFQGCIIFGTGFILAPEERDSLISKGARNAERVFPYLGGQEVNTSPEHTFDRYVISFGQMSLEEAEAWPDLLSIVAEKVRPEREKVRDAFARRFWWQIFRPRPELYQAIAPLARCLVNSRVTKHLTFTFQPTDRVFSEQLSVFPLDAYTAFAVLQSRVHEGWAWLLSSTMRNAGIRYAASDCFETIPFPAPDPRTVLPDLESIGEALYTARAEYMVTTQQGLTKTYNALKDPGCHDPAVVQLRDLHQQMDAAVLAAYGWGDLQVPLFCPATPAEQQALEAFKAEVIDRLFVLNAERASAEAGGLPLKTAPKTLSEHPPANDAAEAAARVAIGNGRPLKPPRNAKPGRGSGAKPARSQRKRR